MPKHGGMTPPDLLTEDPDGQGRPAYADEQYLRWLDMMRTWLEMSSSLYHAACSAGLESHYNVIRRKYALGDWFSVKVDALRAKPGELGNEAEVRSIRQILDRVKREEPLNRQEVDLLKHFNEKHRSAQPFFVTRVEAAPSDPKDVGKVLDILEGEVSNYEQLGSEAQKQILATNTPIQDQEQTGEASTVSTEPPATPTPSGEGSTSV